MTFKVIIYLTKRWPYVTFNNIWGHTSFYEDRAERHDFWPHFWFFFSPFSSLLTKRGKKKRRMNSKNLDQKACLSARSLWIFGDFTILEFIDFFFYQDQFINEPVRKNLPNFQFLTPSCFSYFTNWDILNIPSANMNNSIFNNLLI